ncbi:MAG: NADH:flavin oxidoreductase/NADH oxidase [Cyanobacteria bacterium SZAS LIN-2]|nr:NADH:flavin oxidoreductase/NADH oxidase [Cyanobacteria bacterium SZAS LIN-3]MBS1995010.1 NADH:flavin oxidoreductase/NADH oxidase [Cyanobacteria bacterium SZAS LIN-2]
MTQAQSTQDQNSAESATNKSTAPNLFSPLTIKSITLRNRIGVSPMCQYHSVDGFAEDWHLVHLGSRAVGGAGLVCVEASAVEPRGRICPDDLGIYKDEHITMLKKITGFIEQHGAVPAIQIAHAGRKGSTKNPWRGGNRHQKQDVPDSEGGYDIVAPSAVAFNEGSRVPHELTIDEIKEIQLKFRDAAIRAQKAGFKWLEIHGAHGYLIHSFYSPLANFRKDEYGGSFENRIRFFVEVVDQVRAVWPQDLPLAARFSTTDWVEGGWTVDDSVKLAKILKEHGVDLIDCSSGNIRSGDRYQMGPGYQVPLAQKVRAEANIATAAVGMITEPHQANEIIASGKADMVLLAREFMRDAYWPYHAAQALAGELGVEPKTVLPPNYTYAI